MSCRLSLYCNDWNLDCSKNVNCEIKLLAQAREENEKLKEISKKALLCITKIQKKAINKNVLNSPLRIS